MHRSIGEGVRVLSDVLADRATATLNKRAGALLAYLRWGRARQLPRCSKNTAQ